MAHLIIQVSVWVTFVNTVLHSNISILNKHIVSTYVKEEVQGEWHMISGSDQVISLK